MNQVLKRLELIKTSIALQDEEIIELQTAKLSGMEIDGEVQRILDHISTRDYGSVMVEIESYITQHRGVMVYEDKEFLGLKLELKALEDRLQKLSEQKNDYLTIINVFNVQYQLVLGDLLQKILGIKERILGAKVDTAETEDAKEQFEKEHEEARRAYDDFFSGFDTLKREFHFDLSEEESKELKVVFRKAVRLCHPDIVADELKEQAHEMMQEINQAYAKKDLGRLKELLAALESGKEFDVSSDTITDKDILKSKISAMRNDIKQVDQEIADLENNKTFKTIQKLDDWGSHFESLRQKLEEEYARLEQEGA